MNTTTTTAGDRIAADFSINKVSLSGAEQRRLAGMIDAEIDRRATAASDDDQGDALEAATRPGRWDGEANAIG